MSSIYQNLSEALGIPYNPSEHVDESVEEEFVAWSSQKGRMNCFYGKKHTEEHKQKMSNLFKGRRLSEETKRKLSEAQTGEKHHLYGKKRSDETKEKIALTMTGKKRKPFSDEWKKNLSLSRLGKKRGPYKKGR
jgi:hypothetical protein